MDFFHFRYFIALNGKSQGVCSYLFSPFIQPKLGAFQYTILPVYNKSKAYSVQIGQNVPHFSELLLPYSS